MITKAKQPYVNKIKNGKLHKDIEDNKNIEMSEDIKKRYITAKRILDMPELPTLALEEQDMIYIHVLRFFMVSKEDIYNLYDNISKARLNRYMLKKGIDIGHFNSELIGISKPIYLDLIIDYI